jgi:hypothetical protein
MLKGVNFIMYTKTITYTDYNGNERTESFYFNLTKAELSEMEYSVEGGMKSMLEKIIETKDPVKLVSMFKNLILKSYGEKSADGRRFIKNQEVLDNFTQTEAYSELYMLLSTDAEEAIAFVTGIVPKDLQVDEKAIEQAKNVAFVTSKQ